MQEVKTNKIVFTKVTCISKNERLQIACKKKAKRYANMQNEFRDTSKYMQLFTR